MGKEQAWYALQVRQRQEQAASSVLESQGIETLLPAYTVTKRWSDRLKTARAPLFPGYMFCRMNPNSKLAVLQAPGVISIVGIGRNPVAIPDAEVDSVRRIVDSPLVSRPWPFLRTGQMVRIEDGPLRGIEGLVVDFGRDCSLVVSISLLQRSVAVTVQRAWVRPAGFHGGGRIHPELEVLRAS